MQGSNINYRSGVQADKEKFSGIGSQVPGIYDIKKIWNPSWFQGNLRTRNYYEGWYFKLVSADNEYRYAFIPGVSLGENPHSFIQVINGITGATEFYRFPLSQFRYSRKSFTIKIGESIFSDKGIKISISEGEKPVTAEINFTNNVLFPVSALRPGIMGWYRFVPFMETYHAVVSLDHSLQGFLKEGKNTVNFNQGRGYIEKDWGSSMPRAWIWMQSNRFLKNQRVSFMTSVAHIPWLRGSFTGFLGYLFFEDRIFHFATYTGARIVMLEAGENSLLLKIEDGQHKLTVRGNKGLGGVLLAPVVGNMKRAIHESLDASLSIVLEDKQGKAIFEGETTQAGLELVGDQDLLQP